MTQQNNLEDLARAFAFLDGLQCLVEVFDMEPEEARKVWSLVGKHDRPQHLAGRARSNGAPLRARADATR